jgi:hypothetical protein
MFPFLVHLAVSPNCSSIARSLSEEEDAVTEDFDSAAEEKEVVREHDFEEVAVNERGSVPELQEYYFRH